MIRVTNIEENIGTRENPIIKKIKETSVILHSYILTTKSKELIIQDHEWDYTKDLNPNLDDITKRHRTRGFVIAHDDKLITNLINLIKADDSSFRDHSDIKNTKDYSEKLGGFCKTCRNNVVEELKKKFPTLPEVKALKEI